MIDKAYSDLIDSADIISFDLFDTLITRKTTKPSDVFCITREIFNDKSNYLLTSDFVDMRITAEKSAREINYRAADIKFDDIYKAFSNLYKYPLDYVNVLKKCELLAEEKILTRDLSTTDIYNYAIQKNKKIIVVSDMYLPKKFIKKLLKRFNIDVDDLIVSCDDGVAKFSGSAYSYLISKYPNKKILHIGDNQTSDSWWPNKFGIDSIYINKNIELQSFEKEDKFRAVYSGDRYRYKLENNTVSPADVQFTIINGMISDYIMQKNIKANDAIGYSIFGPLLLGFVQWLHEYAKKMKIDYLYFLARDGAIMQKAYNKYYSNNNIPNKYILGSRRAISFPAIGYSDFSVHGVNMLVGSRETLVSEVLRSHSLSIQDDEVKIALSRVGLCANDIVKSGSSSADNLRAALLLLQDKILATADKEREDIKDYFSNVGIQNKKSLLVDIGWNGSMQEAISDILSCQMKAAYFGMLNSQMSNRLNTSAAGYFDFRKRQDINELKFEKLFLSGGIILLESMFTNPEQASLIGIKRTKNGYKMVEGNSKWNFDEKNKICTIHKSALKFIEDFKSLDLPSSLSIISRDNASRGIEWMIDHPNDIIASSFGYIQHQDVISSSPEYIGAPGKSINFYKRHKNYLNEEYKKSFWPAGFKKNCDILGLGLF